MEKNEKVRKRERWYGKKKMHWKQVMPEPLYLVFSSHTMTTTMID